MRLIMKIRRIGVRTGIKNRCVIVVQNHRGVDFADGFCVGEFDRPMIYPVRVIVIICGVIICGGGHDKYTAITMLGRHTIWRAIVVKLINGIIAIGCNIDFVIALLVVKFHKAFKAVGLPQKISTLKRASCKR